MEFKIVDYKRENLFDWELTIVSSDSEVSKVKIFLDGTDLEIESKDLDYDTLADLRIPCGEYIKKQGGLIDGEDGDWYVCGY